MNLTRDQTGKFCARRSRSVS